MTKNILNNSYNDENIFAKIISGQIPAQKLYEDDVVIAIKDIVPAAPVHILVIPKGRYRDFTDFVSIAAPKEIAHYFKVVSDLALQYSQEGQYRLITNKGEMAGQSVFHFHTHILSGLESKSLVA